MGAEGAKAHLDSDKTQCEREKKKRDQVLLEFEFNELVRVTCMNLSCTGVGMLTCM